MDRREFLKGVLGVATVPLLPAPLANSRGVYLTENRMVFHYYVCVRDWREVISVKLEPGERDKITLIDPIGEKENDVALAT